MHKVPLQLRFLACGLLFASLFSSCAKKEDVIQPINGYYSADEIAPTNLLAYWNFDGSYLEGKSNTTPINVRNTSFGGSLKGQALFLNDGYLVYPAISRLSPANLQSAFTITAWALIKNNGVTGSNIFSLANTSTVYNNSGNINFGFQTQWADPTNLVLFPIGTIDTKKDTTIVEFMNYPNPGDTTNPDYKNEIVYSGGQWVAVAMRFNSNDSGATTMEIFANGHRVSFPDLRSLKYKSAVLGVLNFASPANVVIGSFAVSDLGFNAPRTPEKGNFTGAIDEIRVYNKALSNDDINSLYQLEKLGR